MLTITVPAKEYYDEEANQFVEFNGGELHLEHSLVSLSKWESKWHKSFMDPPENDPITPEEMADYIHCMDLDQTSESQKLCDRLGVDQLRRINDYINDPMTATWFSDSDQRRGRQVITAEIVYCWMVMLHIPFECENWHLNRLLTLIRVCSEKMQPKKKMSKRAQYQQQRDLNAQRKAKYGTNG